VTNPAPPEVDMGSSREGQELAASKGASEGNVSAESWRLCSLFWVLTPPKNGHLDRNMGENGGLIMVNMVSYL